MPTRNPSSSASLRSDAGGISQPLYASAVKAIVVQKIRDLGLDPLPAGLEKAGRKQLALLGYNPDSVVNTEWGKAIVPNTIVARVGGMESKESYEERASDLARQLNSMVKQGAGETALFKALDKEYQTVRDDTTKRGVSKTVRNIGGMVSDITGTSFNINTLLRGLAAGSGDKVFKGFKEGNGAKEIYGLSQDIRERTILASTSGWMPDQTQKVFYIPAVYKAGGYGGTDEMRMTDWKKVEVIRSPQGEFSSIGKISKVKDRKEIEKAVFAYVNRDSF